MPNIELHSFMTDAVVVATREQIFKLLSGEEWSNDVVVSAPGMNRSCVDRNEIIQPFIRLIGADASMLEAIAKKLAELKFDIEIFPPIQFISARVYGDGSGD